MSWLETKPKQAERSPSCGAANQADNRLQPLRHPTPAGRRTGHLQSRGDTAKGTPHWAQGAESLPTMAASLGGILTSRKPGHTSSLLTILLQYLSFLTPALKPPGSGTTLVASVSVPGIAHTSTPPCPLPAQKQATVCI